MKYVLFTTGSDLLPLALRLQEEGLDVSVGQAQEKLEEPKESPLGEGVKEVPASQLVEALKKVANKEEYFIYFDQNNLWQYAEDLVKAGFVKGVFPTKADYDFELKREKLLSVLKTYAKVVDTPPPPISEEELSAFKESVRGEMEKEYASKNEASVSSMKQELKSKHEEEIKKLKAMIKDILYGTD